MSELQPHFECWENLKVKLTLILLSCLQWRDSSKVRVLFCQTKGQQFKTGPGHFADLEMGAMW